MRSTLFVLAVLFFSCNNNSTRENTSTNTSAKEKDEKPVEKPAAPGIEGCYWKILQRDTLVASLVQQGNTITGRLSFDNFEKDGSSGPVHGSVDGDIFRLWYTFESEGMKSVMEVWYKKQGDQLLRGVGPSEVKGDSIYFTDHAAIEYSSSQSLQKVNCADVPRKYK